MAIQLKLTWGDGKTWEYKSDRVVHEEKETPPQLLMANSIIASPERDIKRSPVATTKKRSIQINAEFVERRGNVFGLAVAIKII